MDYELAIIGAGPAGYTAVIYAVRAGIKTLVLDKGFGGGLAAVPSEGGTKRIPLTERYYRR